MTAWLRRVEAEEMGSAPIAPTLIRMALPAAGSGVLNTAFEFVDIMFISWLGTRPVSGMALAAPIMMAVWAFGQAAALGVSALCSRRLGEQDRDAARDTLNHGLGLALIVGGALTLLGPPLARRLVEIMGAEGEVLQYATQYLSIVLFAPALMHIGMVADAALRAQGNTVTPLKVMGTSNVANAILAPVLIFGFGMGIRGAACATLICRSVMALVLLSRLWAAHSRIVPGRLPGRRLFGSAGVVGQIYWIGLPASVSMFAMAFSVSLINKILLTLDETAVGVMGVAWRLEMFAFTPIFGLFSGVVPMVGYNLGAQQVDRCGAVVRAACGIGALAMGGLGLVLLAFPGTFLRAFGNAPELLEMGTSYLRINCWAYALIACDIMLSAGFQGLGRTYLSMITQIWRNIVLKYPIAVGLAKVAGVTGVWWCFPLSTIGSLIVGIMLMSLTLRRLARVSAPLPMPALEPAASAADRVLR